MKIWAEELKSEMWFIPPGKEHPVEIASVEVEDEMALTVKVTCSDGQEWLLGEERVEIETPSIDLTGLSIGCLMSLRSTLMSFSKPVSEEMYGEHYKEVLGWYEAEQAAIRSIQQEISRRKQEIGRPEPM